jgi:hypothetical protein
VRRVATHVFVHVHMYVSHTVATDVLVQVHMYVSHTVATHVNTCICTDTHVCMTDTHTCIADRYARVYAKFRKDMSGRYQCEEWGVCVCV